MSLATTHVSRFSRHTLTAALLAACAAAAAPAAFAADEAAPASDNAAAAPAAAAGAEGQAAPAPNPAAEKALGQRFQAILAAFEGKAALPDAKNFTDDFNQQVTSEQVKETFQQVRQSVGGNCKLAGQMRSPVPFAGGYLLQCEKSFVPMELAVEEKAPYRIQSLLIRGGYWKK